MSDCIFCKIATHELNAQIVYEDDEFLAFRDIKPVAPVHVLLIPKTHLDSLLDAGAQQAGLVARLLLTATKVARQLGVAEEGFRTVINTRDNGGQTVHHLHLHLMGGRFMTWPPG
ncbi:MAG: histidine triad nucleotide-binding protein [Thermacetogeniaceae bacterium]|jgi:histidine triad (HIT) family protein